MVYFVVTFFCCYRSLDIVDQLIDKAKLNKGELYPLVQSIYMGKNLAADDLKLMEIDEDKLNYLLEGNSLVIRGDASDTAVCCTNNATFSFKVAEISNPLLIATNLKFPTKAELGQDKEARQIHTVEVILSL